jgi:hypothetical protein
MSDINVNNEYFQVSDKDYVELCDNLKKRVIRVLYLKEDYLNNQIELYDVTSYITSLIWDFYGAYRIFDNYKFLNCICELEGVKNNLSDTFVRKKILDLANFVVSIPIKKE